MTVTSYKNDVHSSKLVLQSPVPVLKAAEVSQRPDTPPTQCLCYALRAQNCTKDVLVMSLRLAFYPDKGDSTYCRNTDNNNTTTWTVTDSLQCTTLHCYNVDFCWRISVYSEKSACVSCVATCVSYVYTCVSSVATCVSCVATAPGRGVDIWGFSVLLTAGAGILCLLQFVRLALVPLGLLWSG
jgi:hypothetical protein